MKPTIRLALVTALLASLLLLTTMPASACTCAGGLPFIDHVTNADAIFAGKVIAQEPATTPTRYGVYPMLTTMEVTKVWKGAKQSTITVATDQSSSCAYFLEVGEEYLLFAREIDGVLVTGLCDRNQPLATADREMALLDQLFSDLAAPPLHPATTVTVLSTITSSTQADQVTVRFVRAEPATGQSEAAVWAALEAQQALLQELLKSEQTLATLVDQFPLSTNGQDFYLTFKRDSFSDDDLHALLDQLAQLEITLTTDERLSIRAVEVMFAVEDCTLPLVTAHRSALWTAHARAGLLATVMGSAVDTVQTIVEEPTDSMSPAEGDVCQALRWRQWYELPLTTALSTVLNIDVPVTLRVTFGVKPALAQGMPPPTSSFVSPLPTPVP